MRANCLFHLSATFWLPEPLNATSSLQTRSALVISRPLPLSEPSKQIFTILQFNRSIFLQVSLTCALLADFMTACATALLATSKKCPCSRVIPVMEGHDRCVLCLGLHYAQSTLWLPSECPHFTVMRPLTLRFRATLCAESPNDDLTCVQPKANASAKGQLACSVLLSPTWGSQHLTCPLPPVRMLSPSTFRLKSALLTPRKEPAPHCRPPLCPKSAEVPLQGAPRWRAAWAWTGLPGLSRYSSHHRFHACLLFFFYDKLWRPTPDPPNFPWPAQRSAPLLGSPLHQKGDEAECLCFQ